MPLAGSLLDAIKYSSENNEDSESDFRFINQST